MYEVKQADVIREVHVPYATLTAAKLMLEIVTKDLDTRARIRWVKSSEAMGGMSGQIYVDRPGEITIAADQAPGEAAKAVAHECRHLWQLQEPAWKARWDRERKHRPRHPDDSGDGELDAVEYERGIFKAFEKVVKQRRLPFLAE